MNKMYLLLHNILFCNLHSCFPLQCDGVPMSLPSLQGLAVLNIPSYAGGINFWGGTKEDNVRVTEVVLQCACSTSKMKRSSQLKSVAGCV